MDSSLRWGLCGLVLLGACSSGASHGPGWTDPGDPEPGSPDASGATGSSGSGSGGGSSSGGSGGATTPGGGNGSSGSPSGSGSGAASPADGGFAPTYDGGIPPTDTTPGKPACGSGPAGRNVGDVAEDFMTYDQFGSAIRLSDYCSKWVYVEYGRMSCGACVSEAPVLQDAYVKYQSQNLMVIETLGATLNKDPVTGVIGTPSPPALMTWATTYGETLPVVADPDYALFGRYWPFGPGTAFPQADDQPMPEAILVKPGAVIVHIGQLPEAILGQCITGQCNVQ